MPQHRQITPGFDRDQLCLQHAERGLRILGENRGLPLGRANLPVLEHIERRFRDHDCLQDVSVVELRSDERALEERVVEELHCNPR